MIAILNTRFYTNEHEDIVECDRSRFTTFFEHDGRKGIYTGGISSGITEEEAFNFDEWVTPLIEDWIKEDER